MPIATWYVEKRPVAPVGSLRMELSKRTSFMVRPSISLLAVWLLTVGSSWFAALGDDGTGKDGPYPTAKIDTQDGAALARTQQNRRVLTLTWVALTTTARSSAGEDEPPSTSAEMRLEGVRPFPAAVSLAWKRAGAVPGWMSRDEYGWLLFRQGQNRWRPGEWPAFRVPRWEAGRIKKSSQSRTADCEDWGGKTAVWHSPCWTQSLFRKGEGWERNDGPVMPAASAPSGGRPRRRRSSRSPAAGRGASPG